MNFDSIIEHPKTVNEAVIRLLAILSADEKVQIRAMTQDDLVLLHFSLGKNIRNAFGLNSENNVLLDHRSADDVSMEIIETLWKKL